MTEMTRDPDEPDEGVDLSVLFDAEVAAPPEVHEPLEGETTIRLRAGSIRAGVRRGELILTVASCDGMVSIALPRDDANLLRTILTNLSMRS